MVVGLTAYSMTAVFLMGGYTKGPSYRRQDTKRKDNVEKPRAG